MHNQDRGTIHPACIYCWAQLYHLPACLMPLPSNRLVLRITIFKGSVTMHLAFGKGSSTLCHSSSSQRAVASRQMIEERCWRKSGLLGSRAGFVISAVISWAYCGIARSVCFVRVKWTDCRTQNIFRDMMANLEKGKKKREFIIP